MDESTSLLSETAADTTQIVETQTAETTATPVEAKPTDTKAEETKAEGSEAKTEQKAESKPEGAPEEYAEFQAPEGVELDADVVSELKSIAKGMNLPQDKAQQIVDLGVKMQQKQSEAWQAQIEKWVGDVKSDKEIGGDKLPENLATARKAVERFGTPELRQLLDTSGMGNHPEMIKAFIRIGKQISEDGFVSGSATAGVKQGLAERLYGSSK